MAFHRIISAEVAAPLVGTPFANHPANQCLLPCFLALLIDLPSTNVFHHRGVQYGGRPTIFILSSAKPDAPFSDLFVPLPGHALFIHLFPPIPVLDEELAKAAQSSLTVTPSVIDSVIAAFYTTLKQRTLSLSRTAFPSSVGPEWPLFPASLSDDIVYDVHVSATLPRHGPSPRDICDYLCFNNVVRAELSYPQIDVTMRWLRRVRTQPWAPSSFQVPKSRLRDISVLQQLYALQGIPPRDNNDVAEEPEAFEHLRIPPPVSSPECRLIVLDIVGMVQVRQVGLDLLSSIVIPPLQDRMRGLQSLLGTPSAQRLLELESLEFSAGCGSYSEILRRSLVRLAAETGNTALHCSDVLKHLMRTRDAIDEQYWALVRSGIPIVGFSTIDQASLIAGGFTRPPWVQWMYVSATVDGLYRRCTRHVAGVLEYAQSTFENIDPSHILLISPSLVRCILPAIQLGMATVIPDIPHDLEVQAMSNCQHLLAWQQHIQPTTQLFPVMSTAIKTCTVEVIHHVYCILHGFTHPLSNSPTSVVLALNLLNNQKVVIKYSLNADQNFVIQRESLVYAQLAPSPLLPRVLWSLPLGHLQGLCLELLGPTLEHLRRLCRGQLSHRTVALIALRLLSSLQLAHSAGIVLRDLKPENIAVGLNDPSRLYIFDFDTSQSFVDPTTDQHMPYVHAPPSGTSFYCSHWSHANIGENAYRILHHATHHDIIIAATRRDDLAMLGHTLLRLFHGVLPWESLTARDFDHYHQQMAYMKTPGNIDLQEAVLRSPLIVGTILSHAHALRFDQEPSYHWLIESCRAELAMHGWHENDPFDWTAGENAPIGTLLPEDFCFFVKPSTLPLLGYA